MISCNNGEIRYVVQDALKRFVQDMLILTDQKTVWNSLNRTVNCLVDMTVSNFYVTDGMQMYPGYSELLTEKEKREILSEGFNKYTHTITGTAVTLSGICGFGYVDEGLPKEQALTKLRAEMQNNPAFLMFLSTLQKQKQYQVVKEIVDAVTGEK